MKQLIYIIGSARSGTTLLDIILGNSDDIFSAGELNRFTKRNGIPPQRKKGDPAFVFWNDFKNQLSTNYFDKDGALNEMNSIVNKCEHFEAFWYFSFLSKQIKLKYNNYIKDFYRILFNKVNQPYIVESSKFPMRALRLSAILENKINYIYIKKDPAFVVRSLQKTDIEQPSKNYFKANLYYFVSNAYCIIVLWILRKRGFKVHEIKYEDLTNHPERTLEKIASKLKIDLSQSINKMKNGKQFIPGLLFDGNRIRLQSTVQVNPKSSYINSFKDKVSRTINLPFYNR